jgi:hypothetical protein
MMGINLNLNAQVTGIIKNLQNMHEKSLHFRPQEREGGCSESELEYQDWAGGRLQGKGPVGPHRDTGGRFDRLVGKVALALALQSDSGRSGRVSRSQELTFNLKSGSHWPEELELEGRTMILRWTQL